VFNSDSEKPTERLIAEADEGTEIFVIDGAFRRVELLRLRFREGLPIREIARLWGADPAHLHREYAKARREFSTALRDVVREHLPEGGANLEAECSRLAEFLG